MDHTLLAKIYMVQANISAVLVEVEGMKVANDERVLNGDALAYPESAFKNSAEELRGWAADMYSLSLL